MGPKFQNFNVSKTLGKGVKNSLSVRCARRLDLAKLVYDGMNRLETPLSTSDLQSLFLIFHRDSLVYQGEKEMLETMDHQYDITLCFCCMSKRYIMH